MEYRKKPVVIEALRWTGRNLEEVQNFLGGSFVKYEVVCDTAWEVGKGIPFTEISIKTIDAVAIAINGDYIVKGVQGEFYPCKPDIFEATYESCEECFRLEVSD